ncbi:MAG: TIGR00725 family protein [Candidatus Aminicenantes bacterium RBG_16_63_16]|nr:MAG: TIGR00725 family protein [Candidatus Aminicenantes bacterium RBG_16_63_16]
MNEWRKATRIGVIGGRTADNKTLEAAKQVGELIARAGAVLVCGGLGGVMAAAASGARKAGGLTVGILPGNEPGEANIHIDVPIATGLGYTRNSLVAMNSDALIAINGGYGTLSEIAYGNIYDKPVIGLGTWNIDGVIVAGSPDKAVELALQAVKGAGKSGPLSRD